MASGGMIYTYIPSFMKFGIDVQEILKFCLRNLKGCNVGIVMSTVEIGSGDMIYHVHTKFHDDRVQLFKKHYG
jgi:hypothetical protein